MTSTQDNKQYTNIVERANQIQEEANKIKSEESQSKTKNLPYKTYHTGFINGEIKDLELIKGRRENTLKLYVRLQNNENIVVNVIDTKEYDDENEMIRLLHHKNINDYKIEDLLGEKIKLKCMSILYTRKQPAEDLEWKAYIPKKFNIIGKLKHKIDSISSLFGDQHLRNVNNITEDKDMIHFMYTIGFFMTVLATMIYMLIALVFVNKTGLSVTFVEILFSSIFVSLLLPFMYRNTISALKKYIKYSEKNTIS